MTDDVPTVEVRDRLGEVSAAWDALVDQAPLPSPFLRSWWLESVAVGAPRFLLVFDGPTLLGGLALEADRLLGVPRLRIVGFVLGADHLDLVALPGREAEVVASLARWFRRRGSRVIDLVGIGVASRVREALPPPVRSTQVDIAPWRLLEPHWVARIFDDEGELRHLLVRPLRRLRRAGVEHRIVTPAGSAAALERLRVLHAAQWGTRSEFLPAFEPFARAVGVGIERGELVLHELVVDDRVIATQAWFEVAGRLSYYQGGRDLARPWRGAGSVLMAFAVERGAASGCHELDLLRGDDKYKELWTDRSRPLLRLETGHGVVGRAAFRALPAARRLREARRSRATHR